MKPEILNKLLDEITVEMDNGGDYISRENAETFIDKLIKAFGGCTKCYGKGYATVRETVSGGGDFEDKPFYEVLDPMITCTCDRGKQLDKLINKK